MGTGGIFIHIMILVGSGVHKRVTANDRKPKFEVIMCWAITTCKNSVPITNPGFFTTGATCGVAWRSSTEERDEHNANEV